MRPHRRRAQDTVGQDAFIASTSVSLDTIVTNDTDCKELVVELEPSGTLKIKVQYKQDKAMAPQEFRARENAFNKRKVAIKRRKIHEVCRVPPHMRALHCTHACTDSPLHWVSDAAL